eukprot:m.137428 g.137428  ORF g.137428 m.137428 type:complete len:449 (+) comp16054_c1_seq5:141-1487(+)
MGPPKSSLKRRSSRYQSVLLPPGARLRKALSNAAPSSTSQPPSRQSFQDGTELSALPVHKTPSTNRTKKKAVSLPANPGLQRRRRRFRRQRTLTVMQARKQPVNNADETQALLPNSEPDRSHISLESLTWREAVYVTLDRNSKTIPSRYYKYSVLVIILFNVAVFLAASDKHLSRSHRGFFDTVEGVTSSLFLLEYILRTWSVVEDPTLRKRFKDRFFLLRFRHAISLPSLIDALSTFPWFIEQLVQLVQSSFAVPMTTAFRTLLLFRILKTEKFTRSFGSLHRVVRANDEVLVSGLCVCLVLLLFTATLLFYCQPGRYTSIPDAMYTAGLMLAGQGVPDGELTAATKLLVICTAFISIAIFAIPAAMLAWGFESEAERLRERQEEVDRQRAIGISVDDWVIFADSSSDEDDSEADDDDNESGGERELNATNPPSASVAACPNCGHNL